MSMQTLYLARMVEDGPYYIVTGYFPREEKILCTRRDWMEKTIERGQAYVEAGADVLWFVPTPTTDMPTGAGYSANILPPTALRSTTSAGRTHAARCRETSCS